ncbi:MAG: YybH family protein [Gemmatimonadales bacterium]
MRYALPTLAVLACTLSACKPQQIPQADIDAVKAADATYGTTLSSGNVDAVVALYTSDAVVLPSGQPMATGTDAIKAMLNGMMSTMRFNLRLTPGTVSGRGDMAYVVGTFHFTATMKDTTQAAPPPSDGKYVEVLMRQADGSWKLAVDIWNENSMPEMPAAPAARPARRH